MGVLGVITPDELSLSQIKAGAEPVPEPMSATLAKGPTVADLARRCLEYHVAVRCRPSTAGFYRLVVEKYLVPTLGGGRHWLRESAVRISDSIAADALPGYRAQSIGEAREPSACPPGETVPITRSVPTWTRAQFS